MKISGRSVAMFRCVKDPMIGPKPRQAFMVKELPGWEAFMTEHEGVYVKTDKGQEHFIGAGNIESIRLNPEMIQEQRRPGRPKQSEAV